jgi:hypothetical protein
MQKEQDTLCIYFPMSRRPGLPFSIRTCRVRVLIKSLPHPSTHHPSTTPWAQAARLSGPPTLWPTCEPASPAVLGEGMGIAWHGGLPRSLSSDVPERKEDSCLHADRTETVPMRELSPGFPDLALVPTPPPPPRIEPIPPPFPGLCNVQLMQGLFADVAFIFITHCDMHLLVSSRATEPASPVLSTRGIPHHDGSALSVRSNQHFHLHLHLHHHLTTSYSRHDPSSVLLCPQKLDTALAISYFFFAVYVTRLPLLPRTFFMTPPSDTQQSQSTKSR